MGCYFGVITDRVPDVDRDYQQTGNILLDHLDGATHEPMSVGDDRTAKLTEMAARIGRSGLRPYVVPYGCANRLGAISYLGAALEIADQARAMEVAITHVVHASGSGGGQAGLIAGLAALGLDIEVIGIDVDADLEGVHHRVASILRELAECLGLSHVPLREALQRLEFKGFVAISPRRGAFVVPPTRSDAAEIFELRADLETATLRPSVPRLSPTNHGRDGHLPRGRPYQRHRRLQGSELAVHRALNATCDRPRTVTWSSPLAERQPILDAAPPPGSPLPRVNARAPEDSGRGCEQGRRRDLLREHIGAASTRIQTLLRS
ncbi:hypothetical protein GCM10009559_60720 [Pseudonocardia zijingensis]|uniref:Tryptophan synthase beta chain-like PALP domain-containing protein n=1 Tax=Pseudonocardia zijingensis TaxID=153376 RepID=A0ABN1N9G4_9PSEU